MAVKQYDELRLDVKAETADDGSVRQVDVRALRASGGEADDSCQDVPADLSQRLRALERGTAREKEIIELGKTLFSILLPGKIGNFFDTIRTVVEREPEQGLRLRLHLPPSLHSIPWEYLYLQRGGGEKRPTDFLALDPRISIVRHPSTSVIADFDSTPRPRRILVVMAEPNSPSFVPLELHRDRKLVQEALSGIPGLEVEFLEKASFARFGDALGAGADIVHFAGHGDFERSSLGSSLYSAVGQGLLIFADNDNLPEPITSDQFAVRIQGRGVQLVVLGACQSGRADELNVWSSVAASLMQIGTPAAIAMQYTIWNESALAFSRSFYRALAAGLPLDWAVSEGRHAVFDRCTRVKDDPNLGKYWRDWGVPVLYLRAGEEFILPTINGVMQPEEREMTRKETIRDSDPVASNTGHSENRAEFHGHTTIHGDFAMGNIHKTDQSVKVEDGVQVGPGAQVILGTGNVQTMSKVTSWPLSATELPEVDHLVELLRQQLAITDVHAGKKIVAEEFITQLESEAKKTTTPPDPSIIKSAGAWLLKNVPSIAGTLAAFFLNPIVGKVVAAAGDIAADWVKESFS